MAKKAGTIISDQKMEILRLETEPFGTNAYMVFCRESGQSVLIDAPGNAELITEHLKESSPQFILITHGHMDHVTVLEDLYRKLGASLAAHQAEAGQLPVKPDRLLEDGASIKCGKLSLEVIHAPGHTPGSICFRLGNYLLSGDTIFPGGPGKTASPEKFKQIVKSIEEKIMALPDQTVILPGHGDPTDLKTEREQFNAFRSRQTGDQLDGDVTWTNS